MVRGKERIETEIRFYTVVCRSEVVRNISAVVVKSFEPVAVPGLLVWCSMSMNDFASVLVALLDDGVAEDEFWVTLCDGLDGVLGISIPGSQYVLPWLIRRDDGSSVFVSRAE